LTPFPASRILSVSIGSDLASVGGLQGKTGGLEVRRPVTFCEVSVANGAAITFPVKRYILGAQEFFLLMRNALLGTPWMFKYGRETLRQINIIGVTATPLVLLAALFIGLVLALEWGTKLEPFGAKILMGRIVSIGTIREIGPVITGLMLAGRNGAKISAELGSMKVTEQISALTALGTDPIRRLVVPRQVASILTILPLTVFADAVAIVAGYVVAVAWLHTPGNLYWTSALDSLLMKDLAIGLLKPFFFGYIIATIACYYGMNTEGGATAVGDSATKAVMFSSLGVLASDFVLSKLIISFFR
jgi:phospholipid/cholesterol/gamma-HCH transport system permease protein